MIEVELIAKDTVEVVQVLQQATSSVQVDYVGSDVFSVSLVPNDTISVANIIKPHFSLTNTTATIPVPGPQGEQGIPGEPGVPGPAQEITQGDLLELLTYIHQQNIPAATWVINHNLNSHPSVVVIDSAGDECEGQLTYTDTNNITIIFSAAFSGIAYLNS
jgi:hypothetical protein